MIENITVFTDASYDPLVKKASFAAWIRYNEDVFLFSKMISNCDDSNLAELMAIDAVIYELTKIGLPLKGKRVVLVTDSDNCIDIIKKSIHDHTNGLKPEFVKLRKRILVNRNNHGFILKINPIKSHVQPNKSRDMINRWCDMQAKLILFKNFVKSKRAWKRGKGGDNRWVYKWVKIWDFAEIAKDVESSYAHWKYQRRLKLRKEREEKEN